MRFSTFTILSWLATTAAYAQEFTERNIPDIVTASQNNEIRFNRDYRGHRIVANGELSGIEQVAFFKDRFVISVSTAFGDVDCVTSDRVILDAAANWNSGQPVVVSGVIADTLLGDIQLQRGCTVATR